MLRTALFSSITQLLTEYEQSSEVEGENFRRLATDDDDTIGWVYNKNQVLRR